MIRLDNPRQARRRWFRRAGPARRGLWALIWAAVFLPAVIWGLPAPGEAGAEGLGEDRAQAHGWAARRAVDGPAAVEPTPLPIPAAAQTAVLIPTTALIWNPSGTGTYLWDAPGGAISGFIENGLVVEVLNQWDSYGGVPFGEVRWDGQPGWLDMRAVHRVAVPESGFLRLENSGYLYSAPGGRILDWLPAGTPVVVQDQIDSWTRIELFIGGKTGWVTVSP